LELSVVFLGRVDFGAMKFILFSGSLRTGSLNKKLMHVIARYIASRGSCDVEVVDLKSLDIPVYDGDIELAGLPDGVRRLGEHIADADALIITSPEYNGSIASPLKNAIDWISRLRPVPFEKKPTLLTGASPGGFGSIRALGHSRAPLEAVGCYLFPQSFGLAKANEAFDEAGELKDEAATKRLYALLESYIEYANKLKTVR
jgi:NAD(P)H-dependent FMN reductase